MSWIRRTIVFLFGNCLPGILLHTDLPEIAASLSPRKVCLAGTVSGAGKTMDVAVVRRVYGDGAHLTLLAAARWDAERLSG